jgi:hypothetical protein
LGATRAVDFSGTPGHLVSVSSTQVVAAVPTGLGKPTSSVTVIVTDQLGCPVQVPAGSFNLRQPCGGKVVPGQGTWGDPVRIVGEGLTASVEVMFACDVPATVTSVGAGEIWVVVPEGASTGAVTVRAYDCGRQICEFETAEFSVTPQCAPVLTGAASTGPSAHAPYQQTQSPKAQPQQSSTATKKPQPTDKTS